MPTCPSLTDAPIVDAAQVLEDMRVALRNRPAGTPAIQPFKLGKRHKSDLLAAELGAERILIKDFGNKPWWVRWIGRLQIARECAAYRWLGASFPGLPRFIGRIDSYAMAVERLDVQPLPFAQIPGTLAERRDRLKDLRHLIDRMHAAGLFHLDLRTGTNVLLDQQGHTRIIDLASAIWVPPGSLRHRLLNRLLRPTDNSAFLKYKWHLLPDELSPNERAAWERHLRLRRLWPFNRKKGVRTNASD